MQALTNPLRQPVPQTHPAGPVGRTMILAYEQVLNGIQLGVMLFMLAAGLTLIFGIMGVINLAHGSLYMIGAYATALTMSKTGSFLLAVPAGLGAAAAGRDGDGVLVIRRPLRPRPPGPGARDLRPDPVFQPDDRAARRAPAALRRRPPALAGAVPVGPGINTRSTGWSSSRSGSGSRSGCTR
jgi:hypothetical protein